MAPVWVFLAFVVTALQLLVIWQWQRRSYFGTYPVLGIYLVAALLTSLAQWAQVTQLYGLDDRTYSQLYWPTEIGSQTLITLVLISFTYRALDGQHGRWKTLLLMAVILVLAVAVTMLEVSTARVLGNRWSSTLSRNLSFGAALLNIFLWQALLKHRRHDVQLMLLSMGVGLLTTGRAMGQSLRLLTRTGKLDDSFVIGDAVVILTEVITLFVWYWAAGRVRIQAPRAPTEPSSAD